ncbi:MAG: hypothetical protein JW797_07425 [Bradymonadales bacterium]|nr:hypothetical protein [Bradymonadales bacterium]
MSLQEFERRLTAGQRQVMDELTTPVKIQDFLDSLRYNHADINRSPLTMLDVREAHCLDGALFAVAALRRLGHPPLIVDLLPEPGLDDDHVLAVYKHRGRWGSLAKSNFVGLRSRQPVYRTIRELVMSYFEHYYNLDWVRTLRGYSRLINMKGWDKTGWMWDDTGVDKLERYLKTITGFSLITPEMAADLPLMDRRSFEGNLYQANMDEIFVPPR